MLMLIKKTETTKERKFGKSATNMFALGLLRTSDDVPMGSVWSPFVEAPMSIGPSIV